MYGSVGVIIIVLTWFLLSAYSVILGAELNAELERSREIEAGVAGADRELRLAPRQAPRQKSPTA